MADDPQRSLLIMATSIGEHSARIGALEEGARHVQQRLDAIDAKLEHAEDQANTSAIKQDEIVTRLEDLITKFTADAPMAAYVRQLQAATTAQLARGEARHKSILRRVNMLLPLALAMLGSLLLRNIDVLGPQQLAVQYAITAGAALYILIALILSKS